MGTIQSLAPHKFFNSSATNPINEIIWVDLRNISYRPVNPNFQTQKEYSIIKNSLKKFGWITPITTTQNPNWDLSWLDTDIKGDTIPRSWTPTNTAGLMLIDGAHRLSAYTDLVKSGEVKSLHVPVVIVNTSLYTETDTEFLMRAMNTSGTENYSTLSEIHSNMDESQRGELADLGVTIYERLTILEDKLRGIDEVIEELKEYRYNGGIYDET